MRRPIEVTREQVLAFRRRNSSLDERLPYGPESLRQAAWAGLQDSVPRSALLSIHARVAGVTPDSWADPALAQVWGPRFCAFVVPEPDVALFTLGRYPDDARGRRVAEDGAARVRDFLGNRTMLDREVAGPLGIGNGIRYAATTGELRIRWDGALAPKIWMVPRPEIEPIDARVELARRYLHVFGPTKPAAFAKWAGIGGRQAVEAFDSLAGELVAARTATGEGSILAADEPALRAELAPAAPARLLPSGDTFFLVWGADRDLLVPDPARQAQLWTSRVWPGAVLVDGDLAGVWRRAGATFTIDTWRPLSPAQREAVEVEAASFPLREVERGVQITWGGANGP
ncbi:MAG TPA: crosslink repair DNA glycosylase YcaQ family protein [Candidatus Binatia bacterium]|nr:crosslink repair DNA glycosylase YcaQ family protein [Candidatus Binatia bacterium]